MKTKALRTGKPRVDGQITALAGEFFVAAELLKRGLQTSVTFGNAKAIDLLTINATTGRSFSVQVKALRATNYFPINPASVRRACVYVFVLLNKPGVPVEYFVVPGAILADDPERFGKDFQYARFPGIHPKLLQEFRNNWAVFDESSTER